ncbi:MAG: ribonuclease HII [Candidatus Omnitrophota bacterium]
MQNRCGFYYEGALKKKGYRLLIGVDEVGRGSLAGPVVAVAAVLKTRHFKNRIDDSKKLSPAQREKAFLEIARNSFFAVGIIGEEVVDRLNILAATRLAMQEAIKGLAAKIDKFSQQKAHALIDGNVKLDIGFSYTNIIKGDAKSKSIACASILAKVIRDRIMDSYDDIYPEYGFMQHKGYGTFMHMSRIRKFGPSDIHRKSFLKCIQEAS